MKKLLTLALTVALLGAFAGLVTAQQKAEEKHQPPGVERAKAGSRYCSNCYVCKCDTGSAGCLCSGAIVTHVDAKAKTISIKRKDGSIIILDASKLTTLPKVGQTVKGEYTDVDGKPTIQSIAITDPGAPGEKADKK